MTYYIYIYIYIVYIDRPKTKKSVKPAGDTLASTLTLSETWQSGKNLSEWKGRGVRLK